MKKFEKSLLVSMAAIGLLATSCGGSDNQPGVGPMEEGKKYNIEFFGWGSAEEQANFGELVNQFNTSQDRIHVSYSATDSNSYMTTLKNRANNLPDVFYMPDFNFMEWAQSGRLMRLDGDFEGAVTDKELSNIWEMSHKMYRYDRDTFKLGEGALYGLPKDLGPYTLVYNKTMLNEIIANSNGALSLPSSEEPMTFDEFSEYLLKIKQYKVGTQYEDAYGISHYEIMPAIYSNGTDFYKDNNRHSNLNDPRVSEAIQWITDLSLVDKTMPTASMQTATNGYQRFLSKGCVFTFMGPWDLKAYWEQVDFEFDVIPVARGNHEDCISTAWIGSVAYSISNASRNKAAALEFVKYLSLSEASSRMNYQLGQAMPNIVKMAETDWLQNVGITDERKKLPEHKEVFVNITKGTDKVRGKNRAAYFCPSSLPYDNLLDKLSPVWTGEKTAKEHFASYHETFEHDLDEAYQYFE